LLSALFICFRRRILFAFYAIIHGSEGAWETKLSDLQEQVQEKERLAAQKGRYVREVNTLKEAFKIALTKLPRPARDTGSTIFCCAGRERFRRRFYPFEPKQAEKKSREVEELLLKPAPAKAAAQKPADKKPAAASNPQEEQFL